MYSSTTEATPARFEWIISGEKGSLRFASQSQFIAIAPHTLHQSTLPEPAGKGEEGKEKTAFDRKTGGQWEEVEVEKGSLGGIGAVYAAFAEGDRDLVDFDEAAKRHRMAEAIFRSAKNGTRESY